MLVNVSKSVDNKSKVVMIYSFKYEHHNTMNPIKMIGRCKKHSH